MIFKMISRFIRETCFVSNCFVRGRFVLFFIGEPSQVWLMFNVGAVLCTSLRFDQRGEIFQRSGAIHIHRHWSTTISFSPYADPFLHVTLWLREQWGTLALGWIPRGSFLSVYDVSHTVFTASPLKLR